MKYSLTEIDQAAKYILASAKTDTLLFDGPMGFGKTTLISAICKELGINDQISSPTFSIVNEYQGKSQKIYHFDLYRINTIDELYEMGVEDYLDGTALKLIEWPEKIIPFLSDYQTITFKSISDTKREIQITDVVYR